MKELTYISPLRAGFVMSWVVLVAAFMSVFVFEVPMIVITSGKLSAPMLISLLMLPVGAGISAFFGTIFGCWTYNWIATRFGGIKVGLS